LVIIETIFFFNPFITTLCKKIKLEREKNCDVNVLAFQYSPALYAEALLQAERLKQLSPVFQLAAVNQKKDLLHRIQFFTNEKVINQTLRFNIVAPVIGLILLFMLSTALLLQSQNNGVGQLQSDTGIHFLPAGNYIIPNTEYGNAVLPTIIAEPILPVSDKQQQPSIVERKHLITPATVCEPEATVDTEEATEPFDLNYARPATFTQNDATRQIVIKEESSGIASVKIYNLYFVNGKWVLQPEWVVTAKEIMLDSLGAKIDSIQRKLGKIYPDQQ
jgi:putative effector of murein hydrolase LrgA (UPF0299 family)